MSISASNNLSLTASQRSLFLRRLLGHRSFVLGAAGLLIILVLAFLAPLVTWHDPYLQDLGNRRVPPIWYAWFFDNPDATWNHPLGTDRLGRDYWSRLVYGSRISLSIGIVGVFLSLVLGVVIGGISGYYGG